MKGPIRKYIGPAMAAAATGPPSVATRTDATPMSAMPALSMMAESCLELLPGVQPEPLALSERVGVHQREHREDGDDAAAVDLHQTRRVGGLQDRHAGSSCAGGTPMIWFTTSVKTNFSG